MAVLFCLVFVLGPVSDFSFRGVSEGVSTYVCSVFRGGFSVSFRKYVLVAVSGSVSRSDSTMD